MTPEPTAAASAPAPDRTRRVLRWVLAGVLAAPLLGALALAVLALLLVPFTPAVDGVLKARDERASVLLAADGSELTRFRRLNREWLALDQIPGHVVDALIATEDHRFWQHPGVDWRRSLSALGHTLAGGRQGGSTLEQQLARNFFTQEIGHAPTVVRKLKEILTALKLDRAYTKRELLEAYLNTVPFHYNAFGIEMAARTYFNKPASRLGVAEGATLVGLLKGTRAYNPVSSPQRALERRNLVLTRMVQHGKLAAATAAALQRRPLRLDFVRQDLEQGPAPHFADAVRRWATGWAEAQGLDLFADGLVLQATLDPRLQRLAQRAVERQLQDLQAVAEVEWASASAALRSTRLDTYRAARRGVQPFAHFWSSRADLLDSFVRESPSHAALLDSGRSEAQALAQLKADDAFIAALKTAKTRLEAGFVAIEPSSGAVRAWVGSRDFAIDSFDHVQQARRQPGSTFKPFVYAAALAAGVSPQREFQARHAAIRLPGEGVWQPRDRAGAGPALLRMEDGLVYSRNAVTAQVIDLVGAPAVVRLAQALGVRDSPLEAVPSLALGTSPVSLLEMASAYATLAALGEYRAPRLVSRISDAQGRELARFDAAAPERVLPADTALTLLDMLRAAVDRGTGRGLRDEHGLGGDIAGKTGTTQNNVDGWFLALHPDLVCGAWVGFNDPRVAMRSEHWGQGAHNALHVVGDFLQQAQADGALDAQARFPSRAGVSVQAWLERAGETLRGWFGLGGR